MLHLPSGSALGNFPTIVLLLVGETISASNSGNTVPMTAIAIPIMTVNARGQRVTDWFSGSVAKIGSLLLYRTRQMHRRIEIKEQNMKCSFQL